MVLKASLFKILAPLTVFGGRNKEEIEDNFSMIVLKMADPSAVTPQKRKSVV